MHVGTSVNWPANEYCRSCNTPLAACAAKRPWCHWWKHTPACRLCSCRMTSTVVSNEPFSKWLMVKGQVQVRREYKNKWKFKYIAVIVRCCMQDMCYMCAIEPNMARCIHFMLYSCHVNACIGRYIHVYISCYMNVDIERYTNSWIECCIHVIVDAILIHIAYLACYIHTYIECYIHHESCMHQMLY